LKLDHVKLAQELPNDARRGGAGLPSSVGRPIPAQMRATRLCHYFAGPRRPTVADGAVPSTHSPTKQRPRMGPLNLQTSDLPPKVLSCVSFVQDARSLSGNGYSDGFETVLGPSGVQGVGCPSRPPTLSAPVQCCVQEWRQKGCESQFRPSHPVRLIPYCFTNLAETPLRLARSRVRRVASYTKGQFLVWS